MKRPAVIHDHAIDRLIERHCPEITRGDAQRLLHLMIPMAKRLSWNPRDLDGVGQGIWLLPALHKNAGLPTVELRVSVDGHGVVRTVLP